MSDLVPRTALEVPDPQEDLLKRLAADIGKEIAAYIEVMYPEAVEAASSSFLLSVRNSIHNQIVSAVRETKYSATPGEWFAQREQHRRRWVGMYRKMRKQKTGATHTKSTTLGGLGDSENDR